MFNDAGYNHAVPSFEYPVPVPGTEPDADPQVCVSFNRKWLPYILGALKQLVLPSTWDTDTDADNNLVTQQAELLLYQFTLAGPCEQPQETGLCCGDDDMCGGIRFNNGVLQTCCCGVWTDVPGQGTSSPQTGQPGAGSGSPSAGGGQVDYCGAMQANGMWRLPVQVSSGDVLLFHDLNGAWHDTLAPFWNCPDGWLFIADACFATIHTESGDPLPTALHMSLVANIGGTYYDVLGVDIAGNPTPFTVPPGITNADVTLQANTDPLSSAVGNVSFCVTVTNNQASVIPSTVRRLSGFGNANIQIVSTNGHYDGASDTYVAGPGIASGERVCDVNLYSGGSLFHVTRVIVTFTKTTSDSFTAHVYSGSGETDLMSPTTPGAGTHTMDTGTISVDTDRVGFNSADTADDGVVLESITVYITGPNPF